MSHYNNFFRGHRNSLRVRTPPPQPREMYANFNYERGHPRGGIRPMQHRLPHFPFPNNTNCQDAPPGQSFGSRFPPYFRPGNVGGGFRRRFPNPSMPPMMPMQYQEGIEFASNERRQAMFHNSEIRDRFHPPQYVLRTSIGEQRENYPNRHVNGHFTEVSASVNFTIRTGSYGTRGRGGGVIQNGTKPNDKDIMQPIRIKPVVVYPSETVEFAGDDNGDIGDVYGSQESSDDNAVAVEADSGASSPFSDIVSNEYFVLSDEDNGGTDSSVEVLEEFPLVEEEYEPENPKITPPPSPDIIIRSYTTGSPPFDMDSCERRIASCDNEGFHEAYVGVCISHYPSSLGRMLDIAGFGVWFSDGNKSMNFSGVLNLERPQNIKAIMIYGSAQAIETMKREGYRRIRVNLETEYLNQNVLDWISKYMDNPTAAPSNWDEVKYNTEILQLCNSATGMIIKWSHCSDSSLKKSGIEKAKLLAKQATDTWMKDLLHRQEAVGTTQ